jgi:hypothetical protein
MTTELITLCREKTDKLIKEIIRPEDFRKSEAVAKEIFDIRDQVLRGNVDIMPEGQLLQYGAKLTGYMFSLGTRAAYERAKRDLYESKKGELESQLMVEIYNDSDKKVTLARAIIKEKIAPLEQEIIIQNHIKNNFENLLDATKTMVMFIQSIVSSKKAERYVSNQMHDNASQ